MKIGQSVHHFLHYRILTVALVDWLVLLVCAAFSWWLMSSTFGYADGQFVMDSKLYSDFGAHLPLIRSFSQGNNFPPEYPFFVGQPIRYHYFFYLLVGLMEHIGVRIDVALNFLSTVGMTLLLMMIYRTTVLFFRKRAIGLLAIVLVLFNGSLAFVEYFTQHGWTWEAVSQITHQMQFASFGPWSGRLVAAFWNWNIFTNQRHLALGYGLILLLIYPLLHGVFRAKQKPLRVLHHPVLFTTLLAAGFMVLPLLHQASYVILVGFLVMWICCYPKQTKKLWLPYGIALLSSQVIFFLGTTGQSQQWEVLAGYLAPDKSVGGVLNYWWYNLGLYLLLIPPLLIWSVRRNNFFLPILFVFFVLANALRFSTDMINNHKFINFFMIGVSMMTAGALGLVWNRFKLSRIVFPVVIIALTASGIMDVFPVVNDYTGVVNDEPRSDIQSHISTHTPPPRAICDHYLFVQSRLTCGPHVVSGLRLSRLEHGVSRPK